MQQPAPLMSPVGFQGRDVMTATTPFGEIRRAETSETETSPTPPGPDRQLLPAICDSDVPPVVFVLCLSPNILFRRSSRRSLSATSIVSHRRGNCVENAAVIAVRLARHRRLHTWRRATVILSRRNTGTRARVVRRGRRRVGGWWRGGRARVLPVLVCARYAGRLPTVYGGAKTIRARSEQRSQGPSEAAAACSCRR